VAADGTVIGERVVMRDVRQWSWHDGLMPGLIELQIAYQRHREPGRRRLGGLRAAQLSPTEIEILTLRFTQRARPGRQVF
jgi:hypothetical protein